MLNPPNGVQLKLRISGLVISGCIVKLLTEKASRA